MRSIPCHAFGTAIVLALLLQGMSVEAQPAPSTPTPTSASPEDQAKQITAAAMAAHKAKNYATAIALYKQAYQLVPLPLFQFNIAQAYRQAGNPVEAEKFYRRYLEREPNGPGAQIARDFLASQPAPTSQEQSTAASSTPQQAPDPTTAGSATAESSSGRVAEGAPIPAEGASVTPPARNQDLAQTPAAPSTEETHASTGVERQGRAKPTAHKLLPSLVPSAADPPAVQDATGASSSPDRDQEAIRKGAESQIAGGLVVIGFGAVVGGAAIGFSEGMDEFRVGAGVLALGLVSGGVIMSCLGASRLSAAKSVAWSPVVGSGFAGVALAGRLP